MSAKAAGLDIFFAALDRRQNGDVFFDFFERGVVRHFADGFQDELLAGHRRFPQVYWLFLYNGTPLRAFATAPGSWLLPSGPWLPASGLASHKPAPLAHLGDDL